MPWNINNKFIPIVAIVALLGLFFLVLTTCSSDESSPKLLSDVPTPPEPEADSPADTIKTLTANVGELISEVDALRRDNADLHQQRGDLETSFSNQIAREISDYHQDQSSVVQRSELEVHALREQIEALTRQLESLETVSTGSDIPLGFGLDGLAQAEVGQSSTHFYWIEPLDAGSNETSGVVEEQGTSNSIPVVTIPRNSTLVGSTAMTALIGRVPIDGQVSDPMPFKVLTGSENLAANGLKVDGIQGMVWSGYAVGDWTLGCVSGKLGSVTFVFDDGTIRTVGDEGAGNSSAQSSLGWISDEYGIPCIAGQRKSNSAAYLAYQTMLNASQAAAEAAASLETTQSFDPLRGIQSLVTGDTGSYVLGKTLAGSAQASAMWMSQRANQEFDAVYVAPGKRVAIHVQREIHIDFDQKGRRLHHDQMDYADSYRPID